MLVNVLDILNLLQALNLAASPMLAYVLDTLNLLQAYC